MAGLRQRNLELEAADVEHKEVEEELRVAGQYLDNVMSNIPVGFAIPDGPEFRFKINKTLADLNQRTVEDHLGKALADVPPDASGILVNLSKVMEDGESTPAREFRFTPPGKPDETVHLMDWHGCRAG